MDFQYDSALDNKDEKKIRLLQILPPKEAPSFSVTPEFVLTTHNISEVPKYQALSYTWGPPEDGIEAYKCEKKTILINGGLFLVLSNLMDALCHILQAWDSADPVPHIWINAICINQQNPIERGLQVQFMSEIYQTASQVLIWLGKSNMESRTAFDFIRKQGDLSRIAYQQCMQNNSGLYASVFHALCQVLNRRWFTRIWTLQEFAFASGFDGPLMICGRDRLQWRLFYILGYVDNEFRNRYLEEKHSGPLAGHFWKAQEYWSIVSTLHKMRQDIGIGSGYHLPYLLQATRYFASTDPRDRVYALLGLAEGEYRRELKVVYEDNVDDSDDVYVKVYINAVKCSIEIDNSLNIVALQTLQKKIKGLPSWVPDFSLTNIRGYSHLLPQDLEVPQMKSRLPKGFWAQYLASGRSQPLIRFSANNRHLSIKGVKFGRVCEVIGPFNSLESYLQKVQQCTSRAALRRLPRGHPHRGLHYLCYRSRASIWRVLVANKDETGHVPAPNWYEDVIKAMLSGGHITDALGVNRTKTELPHLALVQKSLAAAISDRKFFRTDFGFVGIGPDNIKNGDL
ncbi:HET-domain-containing protein [Hyaloscypha bicolor E]|uniref:HET-domain-containing protein n=1 Tax=Hyaloscypha bicolor E TaxID=1095630 RepID=A0A2J6T4K6_9HELO|nr:HET-domain-containing protein [Hyaloscypha bicolor E]PMD57957.1 HET-domain-containing protein [Hyaloscypha bicolor E]